MDISNEVNNLILDSHINQTDVMDINSEADSLDYHYQLYHSVLDVDPLEWGKLLDPAIDVAMDQRLIHLLETTLCSQAQFWTVVIRNAQQQIMAGACLTLFQTDILQSASPFFKNRVESIRRKYPNALKWKVLFCGLPIPSGKSHLRFSPAADIKSVLTLLNDVMQKVATQERAHLIVFKEFDAVQAQQIQHLGELDFCRGEMAYLFQLPGHFKNFEDYRLALRARYRNQVNANIKKFNVGNLRVEHIVDPQEIEARFTDEVHQLYLNVWAKSKEKLECLPLNFFKGLGHALPGQVSVTFISRDKEVVAFTIAIAAAEVYHNLYAGINYRLNDQLDLYFNLFYQELDFAFGLNKKAISLGQTSDSFKSRIGAIAEPRYFFVRARHTIIQRGIKWFQSLIFPNMSPPKQHNVFK